MQYTPLLLILFLCACSGKPEQAAETAPKATDVVTLTEAQVKNGGIVTGIVGNKIMKTELVVNGVADVPPQNIVSVSFPLGGYLKSTNLLPGLRIRKGAVIATIEDQALIQLQQDYLITKAKLEYASRDFERQRVLNESKVNADKVLQQAQADYQSQKVLLKGYAEKLRLVGIDPARLTENTISRSVSLHSPIDGFVSKVNVNIGKYVTPSEVLFELINPSDIHAALNVFERDLGKVAPGQRVVVTLVDDPKKEYAAEVLLVTRNVDESRSALIHCHFEQHPALLLPGMFLRGRIEVKGMDVQAVPDEAVVRYGAGDFLVADMGGNRYELLPVTTGTRYEGYVEIQPGKDNLAGRKVVVKNAYAVLSAMRNKSE